MLQADISVARQYRCNHASAKATDKAAKSSRLKQPPWQPVLAKAAPLPGDAGSRSSRRRTSGSVEFWVHETISFAQGCNKDILDLDAVEVRDGWQSAKLRPKATLYHLPFAFTMQSHRLLAES